MLGRWPVAAIFAVLLLATTWRGRVAGFGIHIDSDSMKVVGLLDSRQFSWDSIDHYACGPLAAIGSRARGLAY
jgi:hypothetical protein